MMSDRIDIRDLGKLRAGKNAAGKTSGSANGEVGGLWALLNKDIRLFGRSLPDKIKESFYVELSTLLAAGMDIRASLELIRDEQTKRKFRELFGLLLEEIVAGQTLSSAMKERGLFTSYEYYSVRIGEETGKLVVVLSELALYYKKKIGQRRQIIGALTYPVLVMVVAVCAVSFMMAYVVPMFADVLKRFGGDLPLITKIVLRFSQMLKKFSLGIVLLLTGTIVLAISQRKKTWFRKWTSAFLLKIPIVGDIVRKIYLSRFANTMALMISSHIPMLQAIRLLQQMLSFYPIQSSLSQVEDEVMSGAPLNKSLGKHAIYPQKMISLVKVGEEVNQLDLFFRKISMQYSDEVEYRTNLLSKFLEPLIIVVLGLVVGIILIAMYLPLFKLGQAV